MDSRRLDRRTVDQRQNYPCYRVERRSFLFFAASAINFLTPGLFTSATLRSCHVSHAIPRSLPQLLRVR